MSINARFQFRYDTSANWTANNPLLLAGELGLESDTHNFKMGDGSTLWNSLSYVASGPQGPQGPIGTFGNVGSITLNFGSAPGSYNASANITGQTGILSNSKIWVWMSPGLDTLGQHSEDEYVMANITVVGGNIIPGTGFNIKANAEFQITGNFTVGWVWM